MDSNEESVWFAKYDGGVQGVQYKKVGAFVGGFVMMVLLPMVFFMTAGAQIERAKCSDPITVGASHSVPYEVGTQNSTMPVSIS